MNVPQKLDSEELPPARSSPAFWSALQFRDFRLLWIGLLLSNLGTWMQITAIGFLVVHVAKSPQMAALWLGYLGLAQAIPSLLVSPIAGVVADIFPRRRILWYTNVGSALCALGLAAVAQHGAIALAPILLISMVTSGIRALDVPARQSWVPQLIPRKYLGNAIGLQSLAFNAPSIVGPAIAGLMLTSMNSVAIFIANSALTLTVVIALMFMKVAPQEETPRMPFVRGIRDGVIYLITDPILRFVMLGLFFCALLVRPYLLMLPAYALTVLQTDPLGLGMLYAASGFGAFAGALTTASIGNAPYRMRIWNISGVVLGLAVAMLSLCHGVPEATFWMAIAGYATMLFVGSTNLLIQTIAPEHLRGRSVASYSMILLGLVPLGALFLGIMANHADLRHGLATNGILSIIIQIGIWKIAPDPREV